MFSSALISECEWTGKAKTSAGGAAGGICRWQAPSASTAKTAAHGAARSENTSLVDKVDMCQLQSQKKSSAGRRLGHRCVLSDRTQQPKRVIAEFRDGDSVPRQIAALGHGQL